jgi:hypothetical protein
MAEKPTTIASSDDEKFPFPKRTGQMEENIHGRWPLPDHDPPRTNECSKMALMRMEKERKAAKKNALFDAAVDAEATRLGRKLAISEKFAEAVAPGLRACGLIKKDAVKKIQASVRRLKKI